MSEKDSIHEISHVDSNFTIKGITSNKYPKKDIHRAFSMAEKDYYQSQGLIIQNSVEVRLIKVKEILDSYFGWVTEIGLKHK